MPASGGESAQSLQRCGGRCAARVSRNRHAAPGTAVAALSCVTEYPVVVEITPPPRFQRGQLVLRILMAIVLGWLGITVGWLVCMLYAVLPLVAAIGITVTGPSRYLTEVAPKVWRPLDWMLQMSAYMMLLVDTFPTRPGGSQDGTVRVDIRFTGMPTLGTALLRLVTSIPSVAVLTLLWLVSGFLWVIAAVCVIGGFPQPEWLVSFQCGVMRWDARLLAYHASLVEEYPPFAIGGSHGHPSSLPEARAR